ncbi:hypothetical protein ROTO_17600 [Roseovarius tolerans]|uniref:Uncharacterized protein n=1 Tax=Roseovarius tolerans TaxID=74031 RepID=A0A0L6CV60_9RHOB|nr:hypothetical protein [Roseovarius tolerans]KNX41669.1 hypothetical protein ROTO_17600 [Roseovarius tolerans]
MTATEKILTRIRELQDELDEEFARRRAAFRYGFENGRVVFEAEVRRRITQAGLSGIAPSG